MEERYEYRLGAEFPFAVTRDEFGFNVLTQELNLSATLSYDEILEQELSDLAAVSVLTRVLSDLAKLGHRDTAAAYCGDGRWRLFECPA